LGKLRHSNISPMRAAGVAADVVAAWHGFRWYELFTSHKLQPKDILQCNSEVWRMTEV
jgi:hypothetical protein